MLLSASPLLPPHLPVSERLAQLRPYFSPPAGELVRLDSGPQPHRVQARPEHQRGFIRVSPPAGSCFVIQRREESPDERVCRPSLLAFELGDLNAAGELHWAVKTGPGDFGTHLSWPSPYRIGRVADETMAWPGPSRPVFITSCEAVQNERVGRRMTLRLVDGRTWVIALPREDVLAPQPALPKPKLFIHKDDRGSSLFQAGSGRPKKESSADSELTSEGTAGHQPSAEAAAEPASSAKPAPREDDGGGNVLTSAWQMHPRDSYTMNGSHFITGEGLPPAARGECRYKYDDGGTPRLECQNVGAFKWVYVPIDCLAGLRPPS